MLYFSKVKIAIIYTVIIFLSIFSLSNLIDSKENLFLSKKVNLGLDLQGGSYLLLEVDSQPIVDRNLQEKLLQLRKYFKKNKIKYKNLKLNNDKINFHLTERNAEVFENFFLDKENNINTYYNVYRSYEMDYSISQSENSSYDERLISLFYTKF